MPEAASPVTADGAPPVRYAGFWVRVGAFLLDSLLLLAVAVALPIVDAEFFDGELGTDHSYEVVSRAVVEERRDVLSDGSVRMVSMSVETRRDSKGRSATYEIRETSFDGRKPSPMHTKTRQIKADPDWGGRFAPHAAAVVQLAFLAYITAMWSSRWRNTLGGRILKLRVTDYAGNRISRRRALARALAAVLSLMTVIGVLMIAFNRRKQALHDLIAGTLVVDEHVPPPIPGLDPPAGG